jgi:predicted permease
VLTRRGGFSTNTRVHSLAQDLRYALRTFATAPGFAAAALLSLGLGVGANTAIFSVTSALLLRPLPYADADRLAILWNRSPGLGIAEDWFSTAQYFDIKSANAHFEEVAIAIGANYNLTGDGPPERIGTIRVSSNLLPMLGTRPLHGRLFAPEEDVEGAAPTAILHHGTWMRRYGGDAGAIGRSIVLNGASYQIVGILPPSFSLRREVMPTLGVAADAEVLLSLPLGPKAPQIRGREDYNILAKLKPGVSFEQAQAEMDSLTARLRREHADVYPPNGGLTFDVVPLKDQVVGDVRSSLLVLIGAVGFVLLIACANVANLLLSRALDRQKEIAVRAALGAGRARIIRQLLSESVLLAIGGGALGVLLASWTLDGIRVLGPASVPRLHEVTVDGNVLLFTLLLSVLCGVLFGLLPALRLGGLNLHDALKDANRGMAGAGALWGRGRNIRGLLVVSEVALSVMVLVGAGLLIRSFTRLQSVPPGFNPDGVVTMELTLTGPRHADAQAVLESYRQLWTRLAALPGVIAAGGISALPLSQMMAWGPITVEGRVPPPGEKFINADQRFVAGDYFRAMEIPLVSGRSFNEHDIRTNPRVVIVDEFMAHQLWPGLDAVGRRIRLGGSDSTSPWMTVVGVVGRVKQDALESDSRIAMYLAHTQFTARAMNVVVRTAADPASLAPAAIGEIRQIDPDLPVYNVRTMSQRVDESLARRRFAMLLLTLFAALGLGLAAIGVYGVIAYLVNQGTREIGIRIALGATPNGILSLVVTRAMTMALAGVVVGAAGALGVARFMRRLLFQIDAVDPATFLSVALLLTLVALLATVVPARRAARVDPTVSLRQS